MHPKNENSLALSGFGHKNPSVRKSFLLVCIGFGYVLNVYIAGALIMLTINNLDFFSRS